MTPEKNAGDATGLHCLIRPRWGGGYVAECLEFGPYFIENQIDLAAKTLDEAARAHEPAMEFFASQGLPVHSVRSPGYWWKRLAWSILHMLPGSLASRLNVRAILVQTEAPASQTRGGVPMVIPTAFDNPEEAVGKIVSLVHVGKEHAYLFFADDTVLRFEADFGGEPRVKVARVPTSVWDTCRFLADLVDAGFEDARPTLESAVAEATKQADANKETWEREQYERLKAKFEPVEGG